MAEKKPVKPIRQAVVLAGGKGIRLRPYTYDTPKAIVPVNGKPFLAYVLEMLAGNGIEEVVMLLGYLPEKIASYLGDGSQFNMKARYSVGGVEDATGARLKNARDMLDDRFLLLYCDNYFPLDLRALTNAHEAKRASVTMTVYTNDYGYTKNNLRVQDGYVVQYDPARTAAGLNGVDVGFFLFEKSAVDLLPTGNAWLNLDLFPKLIAQRQLAGYSTDRFYYSLSTPERLKMTERLLGPQKVVFLDRDGVINRKMPRGEYVKNVQQFKFLEGAKEAIKLLNKHGYEIYIVSNQAGVGRGLMNEGDLFDIHRHMEQELAQSGASISGIYYCPHRVEDNCRCRKPKPGMFYQAATEHLIDLPRAVFIGDDPRDEEAGRAAGCRTILMETDGNLLDVIKSRVIK